MSVFPSFPQPLSLSLIFNKLIHWKWTMRGRKGGRRVTRRRKEQIEGWEERNRGREENRSKDRTGRLEGRRVKGKVKGLLEIRD